MQTLHCKSFSSLREQYLPFYISLLIAVDVYILLPACQKPKQHRCTSTKLQTDRAGLISMPKIALKSREHTLHKAIQPRYQDFSTEVSLYAAVVRLQAHRCGIKSSFKDQLTHLLPASQLWQTARARGSGIDRTHGTACCLQAWSCNFNQNGFSLSLTCAMYNRVRCNAGRK